MLESSSKASLTLWETFADIPDPRDPSGRRYSLQAVLTLASVAMLSGMRSLFAISQFGRDRGRGFAEALGISRASTPCCTTLHNLFKELDCRAFEAAISRWTQARQDTGWQALSVDGKTLRGTQGHQVPGVHLLAAFAHTTQSVLAQVQVDAKTNEHKAALALLEILPLEGKVAIGDAMFCQRDLSKKVCDKGGAWIWAVKHNQPTLLEAIQTVFDQTEFSPSGTASV